MCFSSFCAKEVHWKDPVLVNLTLSKIYYIKIETKAQGKGSSITFGNPKITLNSKYLRALQIYKFNSKLGGTYSNSSVHNKNYTNWDIKIYGISMNDKKYQLTRDISFCNQIGPNPALSFWPPSRRLNTTKSYLSLFYDENDDMYKLHVQLINTKGEIEIHYNIKLLLKYKKGDSYVSSL